MADISLPTRKSAFQTFMHIFKHWRQKPAPAAATPAPKSEQIARDIGLSPHEQALHRHQWPSETSVHPRL
ncbi:MAG: hypothetical protein HRU30_01405 [Rhodobacteraceae bacterium]|nr:hypothetical protein [Paracoccaceae bacterium]